MVAEAGSWPLVRMPSSWSTKLAFALSVLIILVFSNGWQLFVLGPKGDPQTASGLFRALYVPGYAASFGLLAMSPLKSLQVAIRAPLLWLLVIVAFASTFWSINPDVTQRRALALLFTTLGALALAARYDWPELSEVLATAFLCLALASFFLGLLAPGWGRMTELFPGAWRGVWSEKNALGDHMALGVIISLAAGTLNRRRRWLWFAGAGLGLLLVLLSTSKTSLVGLSVGFAAFGLVLVVRRGPVPAIVATFLAVTGVLIASGVVFFASDTLLALLGKDATLTGRTNIWGPVIRQASLHPWTGFGYGAVWDDETIWGPLAWISKEAKFIARSAHDSWLEIWLGLGYIGLAVWTAYFAETWIRDVLALYRIQGAYLAFPFLVIFSLTTITESTVLNYNDFVWVIFAAISMRLANPRRDPAPRDAPTR